MGLADGAVGRPALRTIADEAAGDARVAIRGLKNAAEAAEYRGAERIGAVNLAAAVGEAEAEIRQRTKLKLTRQQRELFEIIEEAGEIGAGELHDQYEARVESPRSKR